MSLDVQINSVFVEQLLRTVGMCSRHTNTNLKQTRNENYKSVFDENEETVFIHVAHNSIQEYYQIKCVAKLAGAKVVITWVAPLKFGKG